MTRAWCSTPPSPTASSRGRCSGASAKCSAKCSATSAPPSSTTFRCRSRPCPISSRQADAAVAKLIPGARTLPFGHAGDGNIHYNAMQPAGMDKEKFLARWDEVNAVVFAVVKKFGGSISAEHGVGVMKRDILHLLQGPGGARFDARLEAHALPQLHSRYLGGPVATLWRASRSAPPPTAISTPSSRCGRVAASPGPGTMRAPTSRWHAAAPTPRY